MADLDVRLRALGEAIDAAEGRLDPAELAAGRAVREQARSRLGIGGAHTVVALAGATGSGKSSLFNALAGSALATVGVRRPTTSTAQACVWGPDDPESLLDWVGVPRRHRLGGGDPALSGLVLLDLPDHDSVEPSHRVEVDRLVKVVDLLVWVLDPQKYADGAVHERYLAPLASHADVMLITLSQADRLSVPDLERCVADLRGLLRADGLPDVPVLPVSSVSGLGMAELRGVLAERVTGRRAAVARLEADVGASATALARYAGAAAPDPGRAAERDDVIPALAAAAGVETVVAAVDRAHRFRAAAETGWPPVRWVRRFRRDPLRRLRLPDRPTGAEGRTSLPPASPADRARLSLAVRRYSDDVSAGLPAPWPGLVRDAALTAESQLPDALDRAVSGTDLGMERRPRWWRAVGVLQKLLLLVAVAGLVWLGALFAWSYLQLGSLPVPHQGRAPIPTLLLVVGVVGGLLLALVARRAAALGGRRRARAARRRLHAAVRHAADLTILAAVAEVVTAYARFREAIGRARG